MYTRSYYQDEGGIAIPENYDGIALTEDPRPKRESSPPRPAVAEPKISPREESEKEEESTEALARDSIGIFEKLSPSRLFGKIPFLDTEMFSKLRGGFRIGSEEILILAIAAFLLFSKDGDRECALILLALLFV